MSAFEETEADPIFIPFGGSFDDQDGDRAGSRRFSCLRLAAPYDGQTMPPESAFFQVRCCDLSTDGISFYSPVRPGNERFVLRLNERDEPLLVVAARVIDCSEMNTDAGRGFLVSCTFIKRLQ